MLYSEVQLITVRYSEVQFVFYSEVQWSAVKYSELQVQNIEVWFSPVNYSLV